MKFPSSVDSNPFWRNMVIVIFFKNKFHYDRDAQFWIRLTWTFVETVERYTNWINFPIFHYWTYRLQHISRNWAHFSGTFWLRHITCFRSKRTNLYLRKCWCHNCPVTTNELIIYYFNSHRNIISILNATQCHWIYQLPI